MIVNSSAFYNFGDATKSASRFSSSQVVKLCQLLCGVATVRGVGRLEAETTPASPTSFAAQSLFSRHQVFCGGPWAFKTSPGLRVLNFARLVRCCRDQLPSEGLCIVFILVELFCALSASLRKGVFFTRRCMMRSTYCWSFQVVFNIFLGVLDDGHSSFPSSTPFINTAASF